MNTYDAIIEMPKGDDRRRHIKYDKSGFIDLGPIKDKIPVNNGVMPVHYGFIPNTDKTEEGDDVDVLLIGEEKTDVGQTIKFKPIALIVRDDGDHKVVGTLVESNIKVWEDIPQKERDLILEYFGYNHIIQAINSAEEAIEYIEKSKS